MPSSFEQNPSIQKSRRGENWDTWKGLAVVAVVAIHVSVSTKEFSTNSFNFNLGLGLRQVLNFCVPLFFAFSGYFSPNLVSASAADVKKYLVSRFMRIVPAYVAWTLIYLLMQSPTSLVKPLTVGKALATGLGIGTGIGYFVVVLCCLIFIHPLTCRLRGKIGWLAAWIPVVVTLGLTYYFRIAHPVSWLVKFPYVALPFTLWFGFFHSGYLLKPASAGAGNVRNLGRRLAVVLVFAGLVLSCVESYYLQRSGYGFAGSLTRASSFIYSFAVILAVFRSTLGDISFSPLAWLGNKSYSLYLSHMLILPAVQHVLMKSPHIWKNQALYIPLATIGIVMFFTAVYLMLVPQAPAGERAR